MAPSQVSNLGFDTLISREWLATNGLGSYASSTVPGMNTRKYHGLLVAAMAPPVRRMVLLSRVEETVRCNGQVHDLACNEYPGVFHPHGEQYLRAFGHDPFPRWAYQHNGWTIEKQLRLIRGQNVVVISYSLLGGGEPVELELRPLMALRPIHDLGYQWNAPLETSELSPRHHRLSPTSRTPEVFFAHDGEFFPHGCWYFSTIYRREQERGYGGLEDLWMPGTVKWTLAPGQTVHFVCSSEPFELVRVLAAADQQDAASARQASREPLALLGRAAEQFVVSGRHHRTMIAAGYPWSAPSGRDAMICLPGLLLATGKLDQAQSLLISYGALLKGGLLPGELAEDGSGWKYNSADAALWFIHALQQYLRYGGGPALVRELFFPVVNEILSRYQHGTELGISADADGLLVCQTPGATWMDGRVGDCFMTPRTGRPVELNALWYNAVRFGADLALAYGLPTRAAELEALARQVHAAFNLRFWNEQAGCCFDVVRDDANDATIRPNQILAMSLPYPVLDLHRHRLVLEAICGRLLTPMGLRTLDPADPAYIGRYLGGVAARERAYHQGSAYPWLLGPLATAYLRVHGRNSASLERVRQMLQGPLAYLAADGMGQVCELFDGDPPHAPGGAPASARSVAELLRAYVEDVLDQPPRGGASAQASSVLARGPALGRTG